MIQIIKSVENELLGGLGVTFFLFFFPLLFSPCYSSVPAVHLITTVYSTVVRTRECVCVREAGRVTAGLTHSIVFFFFLFFFFFLSMRIMC